MFKSNMHASKPLLHFCPFSDFWNTLLKKVTANQIVGSLRQTLRLARVN